MAVKLAPLSRHLVLQDALKADHVGDQQVALHLVGKVAAGQVLDAGAGPRALLVDLRRRGVLVRKIDVAGEQGRVIGIRAGAVDDDVLPPVVEDVAVRIGEAVGDVDVELLRARLVAKHAGVGQPHRRAVGRLDLRVMERAFLEIEGTARVEREAVGRVVRVGRVEPAEHALAHVGLVVAVGVLEEQQVGRHRHEHAAVPELEAGRDCAGGRQT